MRYIYICLLSLILVAPTLEAQRPGGKGQRPNGSGKKGAQVELTGTLLDAESKQPLSYATISIFAKKDDKLVNGGLSDDNGSFSLMIRPFPSYAVIEYISYESLTIDPLPIDRDKIKAGERKIDLGSITLGQSSTTLDAVEIRAEKSETQFRLDKTVFNVGKDLANRGGSAEDILDNVPSVSVDIDGNVSLRGSEGVRILIDGRPSGLVGADNANGLRNIPSNLIEQVEVITNPSARYEAEGMAGIINIILKKDKGSGFNGSFDVNAGYPWRTGIGANVNYRKGKLNWFANYGLNYRENIGGGFTRSERIVGDDILFLNQDRDMNRAGISNSIRFGADYFITDKSQLTAALLYRVSDEDNTATNVYLDSISTGGEAPEFIQRTVRTDLEREDESNLEYSLNYRKEFSSRKHTLNIRAQFTEKGETESSNLTDVFETGIPPAIDTTSNDENNQSWLFQLDYVKPISEDHKWEAGLRTSLRNITNDFSVFEIENAQLIAVPELSNDFVYDEDIHAAYFIYGNTLEKLTYQAGLRAEYTDINTLLLNTDVEDPDAHRTFLNWFPSGHLGYNINEKNAVQISYSRRVRRPRFWDLNPFFSFSDNRNFFGGNPTVNPQFTNSYEMGYIKYMENATLSGSLFYRQTEASIQRVLTVDKFTGNTLRVPMNAGMTDDMGLDLSLNYTGLEWLRLDANLNVYRNQLSVDPILVGDEVYSYYTTVRAYLGTTDEFEDQYTFNLNETDNITWNSRVTARFSFLDSDLQLRTNYRGPRDTSQGRTKAMGSIDIGWSKDFLAQKNLTLTLSIRDILNTRRRAGTTILDNFYQESSFQWRSRSAALTLSYRINQKKKRGGGRQGGDFEGGGEF